MPRTLLGGRRPGDFTLLDAKMSIEGLGQSYMGQEILRGAHVEDDEADVTGVRLTFRTLDTAGWLGEEEHLSDRGTLRPWSYDNRPGLQWLPPAPVHLRTLAFRRSHALPTLLSLWTGRRIAIHRLEVLVEGTGWCQVEHLRPPGPSGENPSDLLPLSGLTLATIDSWLAKASTLGPVPYMAVERSGRIQAEVLAVAAGLEGLHRRIHPQSNRGSKGGPLEGLSKSALGKMVATAAEAAQGALSGQLADLESARKAVREPSVTSTS